MLGVFAWLPRPPIPLPVDGQQLRGQVDCGVVATRGDQLAQPAVILQGSIFFKLKNIIFFS